MSLADDVKDLQRSVSQLWRNGAGQWIRIAGGGSGSSGDSGIQWGICTVDSDIASSFDPDDWGSGSFKPIAWDGTAGTEATFYNISADIIKAGQVFPYITIPSGRIVALPPFCNLMSLPV